jgi:hypothetical protein
MVGFICYRHHPDYQGKKPTTGLIPRLHQQHLTEQAALHARLVEIRDRLTSHTRHDGRRRSAPNGWWRRGRTLVEPGRVT